MEKLKLIALDSEDLRVLSCHLQDAVIRVGDMAYLKENLREGTRVVANAVTLESEAELIALHAAFGGDLVKLSVHRAEPVGRLTGWRPAMPVAWS